MLVAGSGPSGRRDVADSVQQQSFEGRPAGRPSSLPADLRRGGRVVGLLLRVRRASSSALERARGCLRADGPRMPAACPAGWPLRRELRAASAATVTCDAWRPAEAPARRDWSCSTWRFTRRWIAAGLAARVGDALLVVVARGEEREHRDRRGGHGPDRGHGEPAAQAAELGPRWPGGSRRRLAAGRSWRPRGGVAAAGARAGAGARRRRRRAAAGAGRVAAVGERSGRRAAAARRGCGRGRRRARRRRRGRGGWTPDRGGSAGVGGRQRRRVRRGRRRSRMTGRQDRARPRRRPPRGQRPSGGHQVLLPRRGDARGGHVDEDRGAGGARRARRAPCSPAAGAGRPCGGCTARSR